MWTDVATKKAGPTMTDTIKLDPTTLRWCAKELRLLALDPGLAGEAIVAPLNVAAKAMEAAANVHHRALLDKVNEVSQAKAMLEGAGYSVAKRKPTLSANQLLHFTTLADSLELEDRVFDTLASTVVQWLEDARNETKVSYSINKVVEHKSTSLAPESGVATMWREAMSEVKDTQETVTAWAVRGSDGWLTLGVHQEYFNLDVICGEIFETRKAASGYASKDPSREVVELEIKVVGKGGCDE